MQFFTFTGFEECSCISNSCALIDTVVFIAIALYERNAESLEEA
jgi:hypothetical protein